ncbi:MAG: monovalent cation/H(+) antiporter subunit G [Phycisphaeraceae bacterium]|nr:monovalent cation/H(+) antiporter subunit G [Phycisphaeraceae bacterium]
MATTLLGLGSLMLLIAAWGVLMLPDALARQHAATKAGTLAASLLCLGAMAAFPTGEWFFRLLVIFAFLLATLPVSSHMLARSAVREAELESSLPNAPLVGGERSPNDRR